MAPGYEDAILKADGSVFLGAPNVLALHVVTDALYNAVEATTIRLFALFAPKSQEACMKSNP